MANTSIVQINPPGLVSTDEGYISSITIRTSASTDVIVPNVTTGQISVSPLAATQITKNEQRAKLIFGGA